MPTEPTLFRRGVPEDAAALARLHDAVWRETYRHLATPEALRQLDEARRLPAWQDLLSGGPDRGVIVAVSDDRPAGVTGFGPSTHPAFGGRPEIRHLYVDPSVRRLGVGRELLRRTLGHLDAAGYPEAALSVVEQNEGARTFYAGLGGRETGRFTDPGPLWRSSNVAVVFSTAPGG